MSAPSLPLAPTFTTVVTTVDDRPASERAVPVAGALAQLAGAAVELLTVDTDGLSESRCRRRLDDVARLLPPDLPVTTTLEFSLESVAEAVGHVDRGPGAVLCIATHGRGSLSSLALGSVTTHLVRHTEMSILTVGPACPAPGPDDLARPAVAALDGSQLDDDVMAAAATWCRSTGAPLTVTTTITRPSEPSAWSDADQVLAWAERRATDLGLLGIATSLVAASDPTEGILRALDAAPGVYVVGSHRRGPLARLVYGSTTTRLVQQAPCPVLVAGPVPR